jgi:hypothetical protein
MICEFCNKEFQTKSSLNLHVKTAKYCKNIRNPEPKVEKIWSCDSCEKVLSTKNSLLRHLKICKIKNDPEIKVKDFEIKEQEYKKRIEELEREQIDDLKKRLSDLEEKNFELSKAAVGKPITMPVNTNNTNNTNNYKLTDNSVKRLDQKILNMSSMCDLKGGQIENFFGEFYNKNHLMKGINGLASFCLEHLLKTPDNKLRMICTDPSRNVFTYKDDKGNIFKDVGAENFIQMISDPAKKRCERVFNDIQFEYDQMREEAEEEENPDEVLLNIEKQRVEHAYDKKIEIQNLEQHKNEFVKKIATPLYNGIKHK